MIHLQKEEQDVVNTETFEVADKQITRVKKKKIYKKRGEEKVLVRIIKNHCNRGGEVVKTETIIMPEQSATIGEEETSGSTKVFLFIGPAPRVLCNQLRPSVLNVS